MDTTDIAQECCERGVSLYEEGHVQEALSVWREGVQADAERADLHYNVGLALQDMGQKEEAVAQWRIAVRLEPDFYEPRYHLVCSLAEEFKPKNSPGLWRQLRNACRDTLALGPSVASQKAYLLRLSGAAEWEVGDRRAAIDFIKAAIDVEPGHQWDYEQLSLMQARMWQWRASWTTGQALGELFDFDLSRYEPCRRCLMAIGAGLCGMLAGGIAAWFFKKRRS